MPAGAKFDLVVFIYTVVGDVYKAAIAALLEIPTALGWCPLSAFDLDIWFALFFHRARFQVRNSAASSMSGKHRIRLVPLDCGSIIAVIDAPNF